MVGADGGAWLEAAGAASEAAGIEVTAVVVERAGGSGALVDHPGDGVAPFWTAYGIGPSGASLVRPDGYVGWRQAAHGPDTAEQLAARSWGRSSAAASRRRSRRRPPRDAAVGGTRPGRRAGAWVVQRRVGSRAP